MCIRDRYYANHVYLVSAECRMAGIYEEHVGPFHAEEDVYTIPGHTGIPLPLVGTHNPDILGSVYLRESKVYVSFRGTRDLVDWLSNFNVYLKPAEGIHGFEGKLHSGFSKAADSCYVSMVNQIKKVIEGQELEDLEFIFTGHSLGGAMATINAFRFMQNRGSFDDNPFMLPEGFNKVKLVTFSAPPVGDEEFARVFNRSLPTTLRVFHKADIVANLPINYHVGFPLQILPFEESTSLLSTARGHETIRTQFDMSDTALGLGAHAVADMMMVGGNRLAMPAKAVAYGVDIASRVVPGIIKLMHLVPEEEVVLKAFRYEKVFKDDIDYKGLSFFDAARNPLVGWLYSWV